MTIDMRLSKTGGCNDTARVNPMISKLPRKSGIRAVRRNETKLILRDRDIDVYLRGMKKKGEDILARMGIPPEPLRVYSELPFPIIHQANGHVMPRWDELSLWLKLQIIVMLMEEWKVQFQTFSVHIHHAFEEKWLKDERNIREMIRDRLRRELDRSVRRNAEFFFVIEGWSPKSKGPTFLHIHGAVRIADPDDSKKVLSAVGRAAGQDIKGYPKTPRAIHGILFHTGGPKYINYLFKSVGRRDSRLTERRIAISRFTIKAAQEFWNMITGRYVGVDRSRIGYSAALSLGDWPVVAVERK